MMKFDENYVINNYFEVQQNVAKFAYEVQFILFKDTEFTRIYVTYNFVSKDKMLMNDYRDTLALIIVQFSGYFDISVSEEAKLLSKEEIEINLNYILNKFIEKYKLIYTKLDYNLFINDIMESIKFTRQEEEYFDEDFQGNFIEWYEDTIKEIVKNNLYSTNEMFSNVSEYISYCFYKDLDGIYCEKCKKWLAYGIKEKSEWYIISDDLIACPDCVKARNGKYRWLSDFSLIRHKWLKNPNPYDCRDFVKAIRTPFLKKIYTGYETEHDGITREKFLEWFKRERSGLELIELKNKFKRNSHLIYKGDPNEIVGYEILYSFQIIGPKLFDRLKERKNYLTFHKYIIIKAFGTHDEKKKFYHWCMKYNSVFIILNYMTYDEFYDYGYEFLKEEYNSITNGDLLKGKKRLRIVELLYCENGDPYELSQLYATNKLYTNK